MASRTTNRRWIDKLHRGLAAALFAGAAMGAWGGCSETPTEIVAGVSTQIQVPRHLKAVAVAVQRGGQVLFCRQYAVEDGTVTLPSSLGTVPDEKANLTGPITVHIMGLRERDDALEGDCIFSVPGDGERPSLLVLRRARLPYVDGRILFLPMPLRESCIDTPTLCGPEETCIGGGCEPIDVDPALLPDYREDLLFGNTNTCFSAAQCLPEALTVPAALENPDDCTFRALWPDDPQLAPEPGQINVEVIYNTFGTEILDLDDREGFVVPDPNDPLTFRLAHNLCENVYKRDRILAVRAAALCPSKPPLQPICQDDLDKIQAGERPFQSTAGDYCTFGTLNQSESALYVLMDHSQSMSKVYGPSGLQFALDTPLKNPIAAKTKLALEFVPATQADCTNPVAYQTPFIGPDLVGNVRQEVGNALLDETSLVPDGPLRLEAAMRGAYDLLASLTPDDPAQSFNRRALLLIGNREFVETCGAANTDTAVGLAQNNLLANQLHTYTVVTEPGAGAPTGNPLADAAAIATAGGTTMFDVTDPANGPEAVNRIIADLGSCVYDNPINPLPTLDTLQLSYLDPLTLTRTDIPKNTACTTATRDTEDGWNQPSSSGPVLICGQSCESLRQVLTDLSVASFATNTQAPKFPITVTLPCDDLTQLLGQQGGN